jgi:hypothetical protein
MTNPTHPRGSGRGRRGRSGSGLDDRKPTVRQIYALAAALAERLGESFRQPPRKPQSSSSGCALRAVTRRRGSRTPVGARKPARLRGLGGLLGKAAGDRERAHNPLVQRIPEVYAHCIEPPHNLDLRRQISRVRRHPTVHVVPDRPQVGRNFRPRLLDPPVLSFLPCPRLRKLVDRVGESGLNIAERRVQRRSSHERRVSLGASLPGLVLLRQAASARPVSGRHRRLLVRKEHTVAHKMAFREPPQRRRAVEPAVDPIAPVPAQRPRNRRHELDAVSPDEAIELPTRHAYNNAPAPPSVRSLRRRSER